MTYKKIATHLRTNLLGCNDGVTGVKPETDKELLDGEGKCIMPLLERNAANKLPSVIRKLHDINGKDFDLFVSNYGLENATKDFTKLLVTIQSDLNKNYLIRNNPGSNNDKLVEKDRHHHKLRK